MTPDIHDLIERLGAGLEGVTPGPWYQTGAPWFRSGDGVLAGSPDGNVAFLIADLEAFAIPRDEYEGPFPLGDAEKDAAHIALCSPDNIRALLSHIAALSADLASAKEALESISYHFDNQDMSHLDFRVKAAECARTTLRSLNKEDGRD